MTEEEGVNWTAEHGRWFTGKSNAQQPPRQRLDNFVVHFAHFSASRSWCQLFGGNTVRLTSLRLPVPTAASPNP